MAKRLYFLDAPRTYNVNEYFIDDNKNFAETELCRNRTLDIAL
jgi:hypothetical protein